MTGHFHGHLVVVDSALRHRVAAEEWQERRLLDGSQHHVYKRSLTADGGARELGGGEPLMQGRWFAAVRSPSECVSAGRAGRKGKLS